MTRKTITITFQGYLTGKKHAHKNCLHEFRNLYYFLMQLISSTFSQKKTFVFHILSTSTTCNQIGMLSINEQVSFCGITYHSSCKTVLNRGGKYKLGLICPACLIVRCIQSGSNLVCRLATQIMQF